MGCRLVLIALVGLLALGYATECPKQRTSPGREILCYTTTYDVALLEDSICRCTTLVHQGHDLKDLATSGIKDFEKSLKEMNPAIQMVLSVSDVEGSLKTSARVRQEAAARLVRALTEVDGIELNATAGTKERLVHFVQGLKTEMVRKSRDKRILLVLPTRPEDLAKQFDLKSLSKYVDLFTLPTNYLVDDEEAFRTFHPSRLMGLFDMLNTDSLVDLVNGLGAGKRKIVVTIPASVYKFYLRNNDDNAPRAPTKWKLPVQISRAEMCEAMDIGDWMVERDEDLTAPYAFKDDTWIAFEDKISVGIKGKYVMLRDLAGLGIHDVDKDSKSKCGNSLIEEVYRSFTENKRKTREAVLSSLQEDLQQQTQGPYSGHVKSSGYRVVRVVDTDGHIHAMRENTKTEFSCPRQGYFVHPKSCNRFYRCVKFNQGIEDYSVFEFDCPAGLAFDETTEVCVWPGSITACSGSSEIAPTKGTKFTCPDHPGYYADPNNCRFFYACYKLGEHEMMAYEFRCPYGLVFDEHKLVCEWPYLVPHCSGETYERHDYGSDEHGGSNQGGHGGHDGEDHGGHEGGGQDVHGHGGMDHEGHGGSDDDGHGDSKDRGHGGYGGGNEGGHGGHGGGNDDGHGGYEGGHEVPSHGKHDGAPVGGHGESDHGGSDQGRHGQSGHGGHGEAEQGQHGGVDQGGHEGHGGVDHGGHGGTDQGGHGGHDQGGHGGADQGGHGGTDQGQHGGVDQGGYEGHGGVDQGGHGGTDEGGHGGADQGGHGGTDQGGHGGTDQGGHGGTDQDGHGGYEGGNGGGHDESNQDGHGGLDHGAHGGSEHGEDEERHQSGHEGHGGGVVISHGEHGETDQGGHGEHGGVDESGRGEHDVPHQGGGDDGLGHDGHGGGDRDIHGGTDIGKHEESSQDGHEGSDHGEHEGSDDGGHEETNHGHYDGSSEDGHGGISQEGHGDSTHNQHGGSSETSHSGSYTTQSGHKTSGDSGYRTSPVNAGFTTIGAGMYTEIPYEGYGGHDATIQYGGKTRPAGTYEIEETTSHFGSSGINGGSSYTDGTSEIRAGIKTGSHNGYERGSSEGGSTIYHGNFGSSGYTRGGSTGSISGGAASQGIIGTGDSTAGTLYTRGDVSGTILGGRNEQGRIITGITQPGYVQTYSGGQGYVLTNGAKDFYDDSASKNSFTQGIGGHGSVITGAPAPGSVSNGYSSRGTYLAGQTSPGVIVGGAGTPGVSIGDSTSGNYYVGGSGTSVYNTAGASRGQSTFTSGPRTPFNYPKNPFFGQPSPPVIVGPGVTSDVPFVYPGANYYPGGSGTSVYRGTTGSRGQTTFSGVSSTPNYPKKPVTSANEDSGYKTNEYHDNGGRSTIRYNNGEVTHKFTEDDVRDHRRQFGTYPTFDVVGYKANIENEGIFTKTGPTKTGIITAEVGGSGSYVTGSTRPRPFSNTQNIGTNAFAGTSNKASNILSHESSTNSPGLRYTTQKTNDDAGNIDVSKVNLGSTISESSSGYSYSKPAKQFNTFGVRGSTMAPLSSDYKNIGFPTTPSPFLDVHVYNRPPVVTSAPLTNAPAVTNTYINAKPSSVKYQQNVYQSANLPSANGVASTGTYTRHGVTDHRRFPTSSSTVTPIAFTTGPLENFRTTVFEAARIPVTLSTVQPVIDTGYKTVVSPTTLSVGVNNNAIGYNQNTRYSNDLHSTKSNSALDVNISFQQPALSTQNQYENGDTGAPAYVRPSGYSTIKSRRPSVSQSVTYNRPTVEQVTHASTGSSGYSDANDYNDYSNTQNGGTYGQRVSQKVSVAPAIDYATPTRVIPPQIYKIPSSTIAPAIGVTYREPFQIEKSTLRPQSQKPFEGYTYAKPSVKFYESTIPSISYKHESSHESEITKSGESPTNPDIPRAEVIKLVTNYDRGTTRYIPNDHETRVDDTRNRYEMNSSNKNRYSDNRQSYDSTRTSSFGKSKSGDHGTTTATTPTHGSPIGTSIFNDKLEDSSNREISKSTFRINVNGGETPLTTYSPTSSSLSPRGKVSSSTRRPPSYSTTSPSVTTYSGSYNRGPSTASHAASSTKIGKPKGKVIVKYSDLHPLLLGKLGAECTCKADPFGNFRGSKRPLVIESSKGKVDLRNYDETDVYVDLESSKDNRDYDSIDYDASTPVNRDNNGYETPIVAVFDGPTPSTRKSSKLERLSSNHRSGSSSASYLPPVSSTERSSAYLPPSSTYLPAVRSSNDDVTVRASLTSVRGGGFRVGKKLGDLSTENSVVGQGTGLDRYESGGLRGSEETVEGTSDCARPGLFRHPNYCNKFYACHWDEWKKKFTLHVFNCPIHLSFDNRAGACNWPSKGPACQDDNLLV